MSRVATLIDYNMLIFKQIIILSIVLTVFSVLLIVISLQGGFTLNLYRFAPTIDSLKHLLMLLFSSTANIHLGNIIHQFIRTVNHFLHIYSTYCNIDIYNVYLIKTHMFHNIKLTKFFLLFFQ